MASRQHLGEMQLFLMLCILSSGLHNVCLRLRVPTHAAQETWWTSGTEAAMEKRSEARTWPLLATAWFCTKARKGLGPWALLYVFHFCCLLKNDSRLKSQNGAGSSEIFLFLFSFLLSFYRFFFFFFK